ncbi:MAG: flagellar motor switch protein FliN [Rhizobiaceae bacterium]|nr:flagellar motor switch protein FliN [Rhizobiaceae bacterium]
MSQSNAAENLPEDQLNRAIEELRGALREDQRRPDAPAATQAGATSPGASAATASPAQRSGNVIMNIPVEVQIVLGSTEMSVSELMSLQRGSTVSLNRRIGEPVDVTVNGRQIARGEIIVLENDPSRFGIRLTEIIAGKAG